MFYIIFEGHKTLVRFVLRFLSYLKAAKLSCFSFVCLCELCPPGVLCCIMILWWKNCYWHGNLVPFWTSFDHKIYFPKFALRILWKVLHVYVSFLHTWHLLTLDRKFPAFRVDETGLENCASSSIVASQKLNLLAK